MLDIVMDFGGISDIASSTAKCSLAIRAVPLEFTFVTIGCKIVHRDRPKSKADPADPETRKSDALDSIQDVQMFNVDNGGQLSARKGL